MSRQYPNFPHILDPFDPLDAEKTIKAAARAKVNMLPAILNQPEGPVQPSNKRWRLGDRVSNPMDRTFNVSLPSTARAAPVVAAAAAPALSDEARLVNSLRALNQKPAAPNTLYPGRYSGGGDVAPPVGRSNTGLVDALRSLPGQVGKQVGDIRKRAAAYTNTTDQSGAGPARVMGGTPERPNLPEGFSRVPGVDATQDIYGGPAYQVYHRENKNAGPMEARHIFTDNPYHKASRAPGTPEQNAMMDQLAEQQGTRLTANMVARTTAQAAAASKAALQPKSIADQVALEGIESSRFRTARENAAHVSQQARDEAEAQRVASKFKQDMRTDPEVTKLYDSAFAKYTLLAKENPQELQDRFGTDDPAVAAGMEAMVGALDQGADMTAENVDPRLGQWYGQLQRAYAPQFNDKSAGSAGNLSSWWGGEGTIVNPGEVDLENVTFDKKWYPEYSRLAQNLGLGDNYSPLSFALGRKEVVRGQKDAGGKERATLVESIPPEQIKAIKALITQRERRERKKKGIARKE